MFNDLIQYILSAEDGDQLSEEKSKPMGEVDSPHSAEPLSGFRKDTPHDLRDNDNPEEIASVPTGVTDKNSEGIIETKTKASKSKNNTILGPRNEEGKEGHPNESPLMYKDMRDSSLLTLLLPFFTEKLDRKDRENAALPDKRHSSPQIDTKMLKSPAEVDGRTGTKFYDSRPNVTDLLIDIRNVTKDRVGRNPNVTIDAFPTRSPVLTNLNKRNEFHNSPTMTDIGKKINNRDNNLLPRTVDKKMTRKRKANDPPKKTLTVTQKIEDDYQRFENRNDKSKRKKVNYRSVKSQNKEKLTEPKTNSSLNSAEREKFATVSDRVNLSNHHFNHLEHAKRFNEPSRHKLKNLLEANELNSKTSFMELTNLKNLSLREREIAILTDRIINDVVEAVNKKLHYNQNYILDPKTESERKTELARAGNFSIGNRTTQRGPQILSDHRMDPLLLDSTLPALRKESFGTLESLKLPMVTTRLTIKDSGVPLYNIPHSNIYLYELDPMKMMSGSNDGPEQTSQLDLLAAFDQLLNNRSMLNFKKADSGDLDIMNKNLISYRNIFQRNSLPLVLNRILTFSESEGSHKKSSVFNSEHKNKKAFLSDNQESQENTVPEIEIRIKNMPLIRENSREGTRPLNDRQSPNKQETFLSLVRNGKQNRTNYYSNYDKILH